MEVRNCKMCRGLYNSIGGMKICPTCRQKLEDKFKDVKEYIRENKNTTIAEVSEAMDVPASQIKQWIREERLVFSDDSIGGIECEHCGKAIKTGRYCASCKTELLTALSPQKKVFEAAKPTKVHDNKMRFLNKTSDF